ncbi:iron-sulfur cluster assembly scaffold protein [Puniceibacterium sp. IMCC21224]|uniref:iron-sulfur cluster assembly scaffold protein n=1 Tax=Puniceibacterium sp. IMCC21224 TaxID=1618204 RepID=UPI00064DC558|nr:iron-sulfur cluster assembly scaffold protein [Puniceibacterium sp. IMCC21224]KMK67374.1 iron-sulfur cluster biosynthesis protein, NifU-like protein [Puniceibacterium sp. IMCC21224]
MSGNNDLIKLYSTRILALAADIPNTTRLDAPDASIKKRSPLCGSTVTVDLAMQDGRVAAFGQEVKACALGQAAASVVGSVIVGCTPEQITQARDALQAMLKSDGPTPVAPFDGLEVLRPAAAYKNRHASIMLALDAAAEAAEKAQSADCA